MLVLLRRPPWNGRYFAFRNIDEHLRTIRRKVAHFAGKNSFVADDSAECVPARKLPHDVLVSFVKAAHLSGDARHQTMNQRKRLVFAEWHKMDLVVHEDAPALRIKK